MLGIVLAAGAGARLRPLTLRVPKPALAPERSIFDGAVAMLLFLLTLNCFLHRIRKADRISLGKELGPVQSFIELPCLGIRKPGVNISPTSASH